MKPRLQVFALFEVLSLLGASSAQLGSTEPVPGYIKKYAPMFYFHSQEHFFPQRIDLYLQNVRVDIKSKPAPIVPDLLATSNLDEVNVNSVVGDGTDLYLTAKEVVAGNGSRQAFLYGEEPDPISAASAAPAICIVADKGMGVVDVFWFVFSSFYRGNFAVPDYASHVGDWSYMNIRFQNGAPQSLWLSQHQSGTAISYDAMEKQGGSQLDDDPSRNSTTGGDAVRPVLYLSNGTHTTWATIGAHDYSRQYSLPRGFAVDRTERGIAWDPLITPPMYFYSGPDADGRTSFSPTGDNPWYPPNWLNYTGMWGDRQYADGVPGQLVLLGRHKYVDGPPGPRWRNIGRVNVCPDGVEPCEPAETLAAGM